MSDVWAGIAGEFLHLYPRGGRILAVAGADAGRSGVAADHLEAALLAAGQTVERFAASDAGEHALRSDVVGPFREDPKRERVLLVSGPATLLGDRARGMWHFTLWQLAGEEPPYTVADAMVDVTDPEHPVRRLADYCACDVE
ncbi:hypothetical protein [Microbacterium sp. SD291]|uniref:hypothetical protein n=1 Tax=Microbacterium sp. SD291 TaxID=2782007 RepID=UPI001A96032D|nr:hypothetical protein [Microbacterium sp. SD291]MBO0980474.1 hypothetical protein [Microbacterium sp. SD291]